MVKYVNYTKSVLSGIPGFIETHVGATQEFRKLVKIALFYRQFKNIGAFIAVGLITY